MLYVVDNRPASVSVSLLLIYCRCRARFIWADVRGRRADLMSDGRWFYVEEL